VGVGPESGLKQASSVHCDNLVSLPKIALTHYLGAVTDDKLAAMDLALAVALGIDHLIQNP
jgi:mRNA interferase MazF